MSTNKLQYLEGLRGICALLVIFHHFRLFFTASKYIFSIPWLTDGPYVRLFFHGEYQVYLFFILSGRVLTLSILSKVDEKICWTSIAAAIFKRTLRLGIPLFGISLLTSFLGHFGLFDYMADVRDSDWWFHGPDIFGSFKEFFVYMLAWFTVTPSLVDGWFRKYICAGTSWTLHTELIGSFYLFLLTPVMMNIKSKFLKHNFYALIALILYMIHSNNLLFHVGLWLAELSITGLFTIQPVKKIDIRIIIKTTLLWAARFLLVVIVFAFIATDSNYAKFLDTHWTNTITKSSGLSDHQYTQSNGDFVSAAALLLLFEITPFLQRVFSRSVFRFLGKISFALYLSHGIILMGVLPRWIVYIQPSLSTTTEKISLTTEANKEIIYSALAWYVPLSIILAWICQVVFDTPSIKISRSIQKFVFKRIEWDDLIQEKRAKVVHGWSRLQQRSAYTKLGSEELVDEIV